LDKNVRENLRDNPETLAKLGTQDTGLDVLYPHPKKLGESIFIPREEQTVMYEVVLVIIKVRKADPVGTYDRKGVLLAKI